MAATSPFSDSTYRALWLAGLFSYVGTFVQEIGERWLILEMTGTSAPSAMLATGMTLGALVAMLPAGVLADRVPRRTLVLVSQVAQMLVAIVVGLLVYTRHASPGLLLVGAVAGGLAAGVGGPAFSAIYSDLLPPALVAEAVLYNAIAFNVARAVGPAVGGFLLDLVGATTLFFVNAVSFVFLCLVVLQMRVGAAASTERPSAFGAAFAESFRHALRDASIRSILVSTMLFTCGAASFYALTPAFAKLTLGLSPRTYGLVFAAMGTGAILGATIIRRLRERFVPRVLLAMTIALFAASTGAIAWCQNIAFAILLFVPVGIGWTGSFSQLSALLQLSAPKHLRGRLISLYWVLHTGTYAVFAAAAGHVADASSVRVTLFAGAALALASAAITSRLPLPHSHTGEATSA